MVGWMSATWEVTFSMLFTIISLALAAPQQSRFWELIGPRGNNGTEWTVEERNADFCQTYAVSRYGYFRVSWARREDRAVVSVQSAKTNRLKASAPFVLTITRGAREVFRSKPQIFALRPADGSAEEVEAASAFPASELRRALLLGDHYWILRADKDVLSHASSDDGEGVMRSLAACLAGKSRS